jgi:glycosyltransferase involved in cell wall biosynthesis
MRPYISVIIPAFNEEKVIEHNLNQVTGFLNDFLSSGKTFEIIVVDDGSGDRTAAVLDRLAAERSNLIVLHHNRNYGRGRGIRTGFAKARGQFIFTLDADLSYAPEHIGLLIKPLESGQADMVLASAYHQDGKVCNVPFKRKILSKLGNRLLSVSIGGGLKTLTCVVRGYRREVIQSLVLFSDDKDIHLEIIQKARLLGFVIREIPAKLEWKKEKRTNKNRGFSLSSLHIMLKKHLLFNFLLRPSMISWLPMLAVCIVFLTVSILIIKEYLNVLSHQESLTLPTVYFALRSHILSAQISYFVWGISLLVLFQFISLLFIAKQNNHQFEELFAFLTHLKLKIEKLDGQNECAGSAES